MKFPMSELITSDLTQAAGIILEAYWLIFSKVYYWMAKQSWVEIKKVYGAIQAELLRGLLEAQGIEVLLSQEGAAKAIGISIGAMGDTQLLVKSENEEAARMLLQQYASGDLDNSLPS